MMQVPAGEGPRIRAIYPLPRGRDIGPGMDAKPTDPNIFRARRPTPPPERVYEVVLTQLPTTIIPTDLIREILFEINQNEGDDIAGPATQLQQCSDYTSGSRG